MSDTFDVYMNGDNTSSPMLTFNVTWEFQGKTYQLTWDSDSYTVASRLNSTTDGATGLTFENISSMNPIMTAVAPSDVEGKITFMATEKVEPATELVVGSNTVTAGTSGTTNVVLKTATEGKFIIVEVIGGDFLAEGRMGLSPVMLPFVFEAYDMGDGAMSATYQIGSMPGETVSFVIYEVTELSDTNEIEVPAGETIYGVFSSMQAVSATLTSSDASVQVWAYNETSYAYEWVDVDASVSATPDNNGQILFKITNNSLETNSIAFTIAPVVSE